MGGSVLFLPVHPHVPHCLSAPLDRAEILCQGRWVPIFLHAELLPDDTVIIRVSGVVVYQSPDQISGAVRAAIVRWAPRLVLLDLADVSLLDAGAITALLASHQTGAWAGIPVQVINIGAFPLSQLRESGLVGLFCPHLPAPQEAAPAEPPTPAPPPGRPANETPAGMLALHGGLPRYAHRYV